MGAEQTLSGFEKYRVTAEKDYNIIYSPQDTIKKVVQIGKWHVSLKGDMLYNNSYFISGDRLKNYDDWIAHLFEKSWIDWNEFIPAYFQALKNMGVQSIKIKIFY